MKHTVLSAYREEKTDIYVFCGTLSETAGLVEGNGKLHLVTDSNVYALYGEAFCTLLRQRFSLSVTVIPAGEESKTQENAARIQDEMFAAGVTRGDNLLYIGGGVIGDLAGFAAATYLRGIPVTAVPTSLLAMCDSSVGGKCGINHATGKNLIGCIVQPKRVIVNTSFLQTLPQKYFSDGMAEVIKYGYIFDAELLTLLKERAIDEGIVSRCIEWKRKTVEADALDCGERMKLNFGHTVGHSIEKLGQFSRYGHGEAVAVGMDFALFFSGLCDDVLLQYRELAKKFGLPTVTDYTAAEIASLLYSDKKNLSGIIRFITLDRVGKAGITAVRTEELLSALKRWKGE